MDKKDDFDNLFNQLLKIENPTQFGKTFENLCEHYLNNLDGRFQHVWPSSSQHPNSIVIPHDVNVTSGDTGVDFYAFDKKNDVWAIQAKARKKGALNKNDLDSFSTDTSFRNIKLLMVITTATELSSNANNIVKHRNIEIVLIDDLRKADIVWPKDLPIYILLPKSPKPQNGQKWLSFERARDYAQKLHLRSHKSWLIFVKTKKKRSDVPVNPQETYRNKGWTSWGDFLGTGNIGKGNWLRFEDAHRLVLKLGLKNETSWRAYCKSGKRHSEIPANPDKIYDGKGWRNWLHWLQDKDKKQWVDFDTAQKYAQSSKIKSALEWAKVASSGKLPQGIPRSPQNVYRDRGWQGWGGFLGTGVTSPAKPKDFVDFESARRFAKEKGIKNCQAWRYLCKSGLRPERIPASPDTVYKGCGWKNWGDFLGTNSEASSDRQWLPFKEARSISRKFGLTSREQWRKKSDIPKNIPRSPEEVYKKEWISWEDWIGFRI